MAAAAIWARADAAAGGAADPARLAAVADEALRAAKPTEKAVRALA